MPRILAMLGTAIGLCAAQPAGAQFQVAVPPQVNADSVNDAKYIVMLRRDLDTIIAHTRAAPDAPRQCQPAEDVQYKDRAELSRALGIDQLGTTEVDRSDTWDKSDVIKTLLNGAKQKYLYRCTDGTHVYLEDAQLRIATKEGAIVSHRADGGFNRRHWVHTLPKSYERVASLYAARGVGFLNNVSAGISEDNAYLTTSIISGVTWRFHFSLSLMESQSSAESPDPSLVSTELFQDRQNAVQRLIFNGGSATARFLMPFGAEGGRNAQRSGGLYLQLGAVGDLTEQNDLRPTIGLIGEHMLALAIRQPSDHDVAGEFLFGVRAGYHFVPGPGILSGSTSPNRSITFGQMLLGLRRSESLDYALVYTLAERRFDDYFPPLQLRVKASAGRE